MNHEIVLKVAKELQIAVNSIEATLTLVEEGATIPFIARYRKEKTNNLDEDQLRTIVTTYEKELNLLDRKTEVIRLINEKGKLTDELQKAILACTTVSAVDELYLPYRDKKRTRATMAIEKGLEPLSQALLTLSFDAFQKAASELATQLQLPLEDAIQGASDIIAEKWSEDAPLRKLVYSDLMRDGLIQTDIKKDAVDEKKVFEQYYKYQEPLRSIANHRILAINRGEDEDVLKVKLIHPSDHFIENCFNKGISFTQATMRPLLWTIFQDCADRLLLPAIERLIRNELTERAHEKAIALFADNLENLLLTPPLKKTMVLGVDPAFRTGCKLAVITGQGDYVTHDVIYPHEKYIGETVSESRALAAEKTFLDMLRKYRIDLIAIGNGTASRETEEFVAKTLQKGGLKIPYLIVSEAGASVYSASPLAKEEFPQLVVEERSAISIARRVIDPLAELIKIDPKSIGIGQYQHDVNQKQLNETLDFVISKVVNQVGVNVNSASIELLSYVSGLNRKTAQNIISYRQQNGRIKNRKEIKEIKGIGAKTFEQSIGFLKILDSENPLDKTFIHPDQYAAVKSLLDQLHLPIQQMGSEPFQKQLSNVNPAEWTSTLALGTYTFHDILEELKRPLRDIRNDYPTPILRQDVLHMEDLRPGMQLEGTVRNIVDFGAFIDIGLKQAGLLHKSRMANRYVQHPSELLSIGQIITVYVVEVSIEKQRIGLSLLPTTNQGN